MDYTDSSHYLALVAMYQYNLGLTREQAEQHARQECDGKCARDECVCPVDDPFDDDPFVSDSYLRYHN